MSKEPIEFLKHIADGKIWLGCVSNGLKILFYEKKYFNIISSY